MLDRPPKPRPLRAIPSKEGLVEAARSGDSIALADILGRPLSPSAFFLYDELDALAIAASEGHWRCVELLLPFCDPKRADPSGITALMRAAMAASAPCVRLLLPLSDPLAVDRAGRSALAHACDGAATESVSLLASREAGALLDVNGESCLHFAAYSLSFSCVKAALPFCDPNIPDKDGNTALMLAATFGSEECVKALAPATNTRARQRFTGFDALDLAVLRRNRSCAQALLPFYRDFASPQALHLCAKARAVGMDDIALALEAGALSAIERDALLGALAPGAERSEGSSRL